MLRDEVNEALDIFENYKMSEKAQRKVVENGINFDFTYGDPDPGDRNIHLSFLEVAMLLKSCKYLGIRVSANKMVNSPWEFPNEKLVEDVHQANNSRVLRLGK